ncbi:MAG: DUF4416 family protein [Candidatus Omnitrophica bacterium]|nr:DUF4416 family protein [Candidatus Omnitrophota bacterium]
MGKIRAYHPVKLIIGFIFKDAEALNKAEGALKRRFGRTDYESQVLNFTQTDYYESEFGANLKRKFISFTKLIHPKYLPQIKIITNKLEEKLSGENGKRLINIDPGYLDMAKLVLASTKDYNHRIFLDKGICAEITLSYKGKSFAPWEWTYRDYKTAEYIAIFNHIRQIYSTQVEK